MATTSKTPSKRAVSARPTERRAPKQNYREVFTRFAGNKHMIEELTLVNQGDSKKGLTGLRHWLLDFTKSHGEQDEKGSYFFDFDAPIKVGEVTYRRMKAQASGGDKFLSVEKARKFLERKGLLSQCTKRVVTLVLSTEEQEEAFDAFYQQLLKDTVEPGGEAPLTSDASPISEDAILALVLRKQATEKEIDGLYESGDVSYSFYPLQK